MPDSHYVPPFALAEAVEVRATGKPKAAPMSTPNQHESPLSNLRRMLLGSTAPYAEELARIADRRASLMAEYGGPDQCPEAGSPYWNICGAENDAHRARAMQTPIQSLADVCAGMTELHYLLGPECEGDDDSPHTRYRLDFLSRGRALLEEVQRVAGAALAFHTTLIPALGMTFGEAVAKWRELDKAARLAEGEESDRLGDEFGKVEVAVLEGAPQTLGDALLILEMLADAAAATRSARRDDAAVQRAYKVLAAALPLGGGTAPLATSVIPGLGLTFGEAAERYDAILTENNAIDEEADPAAWERMSEFCRQWIAIEDAVAAAQPQTAGDCLAVLRIATRSPSALHDGEFETPCRNGKAVFGAMLRAATMLSDMPTAVGGAPTLEASNPDAELLAAWEDYVRACRALDMRPRGTTDAEDEPFFRKVDSCGDRIEQAVARTMEGLAVQLRYLFAAHMEDIDAERAAIYCEPATDELLETLDLEPRDKLLWNIMQAASGAYGRMLDIEGRGAAELCADPVEEVEALTRENDTFADTIAAFEAEASVPLCMPQAPTARMVKAGAEAAGISPKQAQAIYAAMAEAYRQERAA